MIGSQANSLVSLLRSLSALQKTLRVIGFINCSDNDNETVLDVINKSLLRSKETLIFRDLRDDNYEGKSIKFIEKDVKKLIGKNIFSDDIFKSKYNQEILKISGLMNEQQFKNLDVILIDSTDIFQEFHSKISKISDNILILANTTQDSLNGIIEKIGCGKLSGQEVQIILINDEHDLDWQSYFTNFTKIISEKCNVNFKILDLIDKKFLDIELYKIAEKIYLNTITSDGSKNSNFLDFIINVLD